MKPYTQSNQFSIQMRTALALAIALALAGCIQSTPPPEAKIDGSPVADPAPSTPPTNGPTSTQSPAPTASPAAPKENTTTVPSNPGTNETETPPAPPGPKPQWGPVGADIYPGIFISSPTSSCSTNFLFTSLDNRHIYIGTAAHCFNGDGCEAPDPAPVGTPVYFYGTNGTQIEWQLHGANGTRLPIVGQLAYNAFGLMKDIGETDSDACWLNDFALIEIPLEAQRQITPYFHGFGLANDVLNATQVLSMTPVNVYGHSSFWMGQETLHQATGFVTSPTYAEWDYREFGVTLNRPSISGDSGSAVITGDGKAVGVMATITTTAPDGPLGAGTAVNGCVTLEPALQYMMEHTDLRVKLAEP